MEREREREREKERLKNEPNTLCSKWFWPVVGNFITSNSHLIFVLIHCLIPHNLSSLVNMIDFKQKYQKLQVAQRSALILFKTC